MSQEERHFSRRAFYDQLQHVPALIRDRLDELDTLVRERLATDKVLEWERIFTAGCGDSYYAGLAAELALERWTGLPIKPLPSMQFSRYALSRAHPRSVLFAISNSGRVTRTIEAAILAKQVGLHTVAVTSHLQSPLAQETQEVMGAELSLQGISPGICGYILALLILYLAGLHAGEVRGHLEKEEGQRLRREIKEIASLWEEALSRLDAPIRRLAEELKGEEVFVFVGSGPSYATALFCTAKVVEACGLPAQGQDVEEWFHIQFFYRRSGIPTFVIVPPGNSLSRAKELTAAMKAVKAQTIGILGEGAEELVSRLDHSLTLSGRLSEELSPLLYGLPGSLFAYHLSEVKGEVFFRMDRQVDRIGPILGSQILKVLPNPKRR
ncbi:MAG: SIS domain-containing protein [Candidatus Binatia bacterium]